MAYSSCSRLILLPLVAIAWFASGCVTTSERFGPMARYDAGIRSYVLVPNRDPGENDPVELRDKVILGHPLTGEKLRCKEELDPWLELHRSIESNRVHDENVVAGSILGLFPFPAAGSALIILGVTVASPTFIPIVAASSADPWDLYEEGAAHYAAKRYAFAAAHLQRAVAQSPDGVGMRTPAFAYLGVSYAQLGHDDLAKQSLELFVKRAHYDDVGMYQRAEGWLAHLGAPLPKCASNEAVPINW